jgi:phosphatidylinositol alpha-1,6-mannosyltransferase
MGLRILALVTDAYGAGGGIAQYNRDLLAALSQASSLDKVVVLPRNGVALTGSLPDKVWQFAASPGRIRYAANAIMTTRRDGPFDLVFCGHLFMAPLAALISKLTGAPVWLQIHGIEAWQRPGRVLRWAVEQAALVTAVSRHTRRLFLGWANYPSETVKVLPNTVEERFSPGPKSEELIERYNLRGKKVLLTVSRLAVSERYKGHDRVIQAVSELSAQHPEIVYVIAGDGDDRPRLERLAKDLGVSDRVRFVGYVPDDDLPHLYRTADLFVMPSTGEGFGIVFLQALASGIPVIGGESDGSRDPLRDGREGQLVGADNPAQLSAAIKELIDTSRTTDTFAAAFSTDNFSKAITGLVEISLRPLTSRW